MHSQMLGTLLENSGFFLSYEDKDASEVVFARLGGDELFDRIRVSYDIGRLGMAASAGVELSIVPGRTALKSLCVHRSLVKAATDVERGLTLFTDAESVEFFFRVLQAWPL